MKSITSKIKSTIKAAVPRHIREKIQPRRMNGIGVGTPKSGTTSMANMLKSHYRVEHEPGRIEIVEAIYHHYRKHINDVEYVNFLKHHEKMFWLEFESSCFLSYRPDLVYRAFPDAKYVLTIRDPYSWLDSILNNNINYPPSTEPTFAYWHEVFFEPTMYDYTKNDQALKEYKLYPVASYLNYWAKTKRDVVNSIPEHQLLILNTKEIKTSTKLITDFLSIPIETIEVSSSHSHITKDKHDIFSKLDAAYLADCIEKYCGVAKTA